MQRNRSSILLQRKKETGDIDNAKVGRHCSHEAEGIVGNRPVAGLDIGLAIRTRIGRKSSKGIYSRNIAE